MTQELVQKLEIDLNGEVKKHDNTHKIPPSSLMAFVEKFVWAPAPFQSPSIGLGSKVTITPKFSATRCKIYLEVHS